MPTVIGFTGFAGAGKDTFAQALENELRALGEAVTYGSFAAPIRDMSHLMGLDPFDRTKKEAPVRMHLDEFCDLYQDALDTVLRDQSSDVINTLYSLVLKHVERFFQGDFIVISPREFMQILGTEAGQTIRRTFWVDIAQARWAYASGYVLVPDFRFDHECPPLDRILCVCRPGVVRVNQHVSEDLADFLTTTRNSSYLGKPVLYVENSGTLQDLGDEARRIQQII